MHDVVCTKWDTDKARLICDGPLRGAWKVRFKSRGEDGYLRIRSGWYDEDDLRFLCTLRDLDLQRNWRLSQKYWKFMPFTPENPFTPEMVADALDSSDEKVQAAVDAVKEEFAKKKPRTKKMWCAPHGELRF